MTAADPHCAMLSELSQCAYRLGVAFGGEAERAEDAARRLEYFRLFDRCFFAVRVATALELRLLRAPAARPEGIPERRAEREDLRDRNDPSEVERLDCDADTERDERDRDREREPASLPVLLRTLDGVAADAAALPGLEPAALPTLRELLAHVTSDPRPAPPQTPKVAASLRARLTGSATTSALTLAPPRPSGFGGAFGPRRATGPPRS
jgi:hypothetical protein